MITIKCDLVCKLLPIKPIWKDSGWWASFSKIVRGSIVLSGFCIQSCCVIEHFALVFLTQGICIFRRRRNTNPRQGGYLRILAFWNRFQTSGCEGDEWFCEVRRPICYSICLLNNKSFQTSFLLRPLLHNANGVCFLQMSIEKYPRSA